MSILVEHPGLLTTVQDLGRFGYSHLGISPTGAADPLSLHIANRLVSNGDNAAALEMTLHGASLRFTQAALIAITGAECPITIDAKPVSAACSITINSGSLLSIGPMTRGARTYLAVHGGIQVPLIMGSASTHLAASFGGYQGRALRKGDVLQLVTANPPRPRPIHMSTPTLPAPGDIVQLRVTAGPQRDWFTDETFSTFLESQFSVTEQSNRTGLRLTGTTTILPNRTTDFLSDGVSLGAIQIPQDGQPIVLFVDQQTTGGYPKIANVISADIPRVAQLRPRDNVRFEQVSVDDAINLLHDQERWLAELFKGSAQ
jgi:antagonist of KipI